MKKLVEIIENSTNIKKYRVYRSIRVPTFDEVDLQRLGISWAIDENDADDFSYQFTREYVIISAVVSTDQIDIGQTLAQWDNKDTENEGEVVLYHIEDITVEYDGKEYNGNTGYDNVDADESRPQRKENYNPEDVLDVLEEV